MMDVRYTPTRQDQIEAYKIGMARLSLTWRVLLTLMLCRLVFRLFQSFWTHGYHSTWPPHGPFPWSTLKLMSLAVVIALMGGIAPFFLMLRLTVTPLIQITSDHLLVKRPLGLKRYRWGRMAELLLTDQYVCFCLGEPAAVLVPLTAFKSKEEAQFFAEQVFAEQAGLYWRRATRRKDPQALNAPGVWPPAPTNVQEPNSNP